MTKVRGGTPTFPLEEVLFAQESQLEAPYNVLERKGVIKKAEVLDEIKALWAKTPKGR